MKKKHLNKNSATTELSSQQINVEAMSLQAIVEATAATSNSTEVMIQSELYGT